MSLFTRVLKEGTQWLVAGSVGFFGYRYFYGPPPPAPAATLSDVERDAFNKARKAELDRKGLK
jgi:hypothetical protein